MAKVDTAPHVQRLDMPGSPRRLSFRDLCDASVPTFTMGRTFRRTRTSSAYLKGCQFGTNARPPYWSLQWIGLTGGCGHTIAPGGLSIRSTKLHGSTHAAARRAISSDRTGRHQETAGNSVDKPLHENRAISR